MYVRVPRKCYLYGFITTVTDRRSNSRTREGCAIGRRCRIGVVVIVTLNREVGIFYYPEVPVCQRSEAPRRRFEHFFGGASRRLIFANVTIFALTIVPLNCLVIIIIFFFWFFFSLVSGSVGRRRTIYTQYESSVCRGGHPAASIEHSGAIYRSTVP